ncbi:MAG: hypothetical protein AAF518_25120 [Spirochaetota bacterium]
MRYTFDDKPSKLGVLLTGTIGFLVLNLFCLVIFYFIGSWGWAIVVPGFLTLSYFLVRFAGSAVLWFAILALGGLALSWIQAKDLKILTGKKQQNATLRGFQLLKGTKTYSFQDAKVLRQYSHSKWITKVTRNHKGERSRHTYFYYLAPLVDKAWQPGEPVLGWVIATSGHLRKIWAKEEANTGVWQERESDWPLVIQETLRKYKLAEVENAPLFKWYESVESLQRQKKFSVKVGIVFLPALWFVSVLLFYWPSKKTKDAA